MVSKTTVIKNKSGLHARPAAEFIRKATQFSSNISLINLDKEKEGNAKSIISVLSMLLSQGTKIEIRAEGEDEEQAVDALIELIESGMGEG